MVEEELDGIDTDSIWKLVDLLRLVLISEKCWNPKVAADGEKLAGNINQKKKPDILQACRCPLCENCYRLRVFLQ